MPAPHGGRLHARPPRLTPANGGSPEPGHEALLRVATVAAAAHGLDDVLELAADEALRVVGAASLSISRWERQRGVLRTLINVGDVGRGEERWPENEVYRVSDHPAIQRMLRHGQPYFNSIDDTASDPNAVALLQRLGKESDLGVPIVAEGETWGEVWVTTAAGRPRLRGSDVRFLEAIAGQLSVAIGRAELFSQVSRLAYEDPLTGMANRRALEERLERAAVRAAERESALTVLVCDVDGLKAVNDERGHEGGDQALRAVSDALVAAAAPWPGSAVGRLSGDEFCVIVEGAGADAGQEVAQAALDSLARDSEPLPSMSCGVASAAPGTRSPAQLLRAADAAQYAAKRRGGGQVCTAATAPSEGLAPGERRVVRGRGVAGRDAARELADLFDGPLGDATALDRLEAAAKAFSGAVNAAGWAVSWSQAGAAQIESVSTADDRDSRLKGLRLGFGDEVYALSDFPATERLVRAGSGAFVIHEDDDEADEAERGLLAELGHRCVLGVAAGDREGTYLVELFGDEESSPLADVELDLRLVARSALPSRPGSVVNPHSAPLERRSRHLDLAVALGARLAEASGETAALEATADELSQAYGAPICSIIRLRDDGRVETAAQGSRLPHTPDWSQPADAGLIGRCLRDGAPVLSPDVLREPDYLTSAATRSIRSELVVPVRVAEDVWGVIDLEENEADAFDQEDVRVLSTVADLLASALRSASLYERLERAYLGTAQALSAALEAKDSYTASHSETIVLRAEAVGRLLGMGEDERRRLRYGAAFHDIGKLAVPEASLNKRGALSAEERELIEQHTVIGERILAPVEFLTDVRPLVRSAHERWDGFGYPDGLKGIAIPLGARIIFACDAYDAMTTDRPYREAMSEHQAREELMHSAGSQFDPRVVDALLEVLDESGAA